MTSYIIILSTVVMNRLDMINLFITAGRVENYVDYWGADIRSFKSKGVKNCYESCVRQRGCVAFSMRKKDNRCWLKNKKNGKKRKTGKSDRLSGNIKKRKCWRYPLFELKD